MQPAFNDLSSPALLSSLPPFSAAPLLSAAPRHFSASSLLFIDSGVEDYQQLIRGAAAGTEVHVLNPAEDAIAQITQTLLGRSGIESLHIVSHGESGSLEFGNGALNLADLPVYATQLESWRSALTDDADILLYGCEVAAGEVGQAFVSILSQLTAADVAASSDLTGNGAMGGDWVLEVQTGAIESSLFLSAQAAAQYNGILLPADLDLGWGGTGRVNTDLSGNAPDVISRLLVQSDGRVLATGGWRDAPTQFAVVRYNANGTLDNSFDGDGIRLVPLFANGPSQDDTLLSAALQSDGRIVLVGSTFPSPGSQTQVGVVRLNTDGSLDNSFDGDGYAQINISQLEFGVSESSSAVDVVIQSDGRIVIAANATNAADGQNRAAVLRLNSNGSLDNTFGSNGIAAFPLEAPGFTNAQSVLLQSDGNLVVVGNASRNINTNFNQDVLVFRVLSSNGGLDPNFNSGNLLTLAPTTLERGTADNVDSAIRAALQADGRVVIVGNAADTNFTASDVLALRLNADGTLDNSFGGNGVVLTNVNGGEDAARAVAIQANGRIVVAGFADRSASDAANDSLILRYNADGSLDTTWSGDGILTVTNGVSGAEEAYDVALQSTGRVLVAASNGAATFNQEDFFIMGFEGDPPPSTVSLSTVTPSITEGGTAGSFTITRTTTTTGALTVTLTIDGSSSTTSGDYSLSGASVSVNGSNLTVVIPDGQTSVTLNMQALAEAIGFAEAAETLRLNLATGTGYTISGTNNNATVTIGANGTIVTATGDSTTTYIEGSLRQAVLNANAFDGADTITFAGTTFADTTPDTITLAGTELNITGSTTITGTGADRLTVSGNNGSRIFNIANGNTMTLEGITLSNGRTAADGGAVFNAGALTIRNSTLRNNRADDDGGAIANGGTLILENSTLSGNTAIGTSITSGGGAVINFQNANATLTSSTISGNSARNGGGIRNDGTLTLQNVTVTDNTATVGDVGGVANTTGTTTLRNTIIAGNIDAIASPNNLPDVGSLLLNTFIDNGNNLIGVLEGFNSVDQSTTQTGTLANPLNPLLAPLGDYGGPTQTHALLPGSRAIDAGNAIAAPATDQRGISRVGAVDIGAFESRGFSLALVSGDNQIANLGGSFTNPLTVSVSSAFSEPVNGGVITFTAPANGASTNPAVNTGTIAAAQVGVSVTANTTPGSYTVSAGDNGIATPVGFNLQNNALPTSDNNSVTLAEDTVFTFSSIDFSFSDTDGGSLTAVRITQLPAVGQLFLDGNDNSTQDAGEAIAVNQVIPVANLNQLRFRPLPDTTSRNYSNFRFQVSDGTGFSTESYTMTLNVTEVNDALVASNDTLSDIAEDSGVRIISFASLLANDSAGPNESGQTLTITAVNNVVGGTAVINGTNIEFTPTPNFNGAASFDYTVQDNGTTNGVNDFRTATGTASFTITEVNDPPTAGNDSLSAIAEDSGVRIISIASLLANDSAGPANESSQTLTITALSNVVGGTAVINGSNIEFTPSLNYNGAASFDYTVQDNGTTNGVSDPRTAIGTASFTITPVNDAPVLDNSGNPVLPAVERSAINPSGTTIAALIASLGGTGITDVDANAQRGIALTGVDSSGGTWQYSIDGGTTWINVGPVSETQALLLNDDPNTRLRLLPNGSFAGTIGNAITFRAWDQTTGSNGGTVDLSVTETGGTTAFSSASETAEIEVRATNILFWSNSTTGETVVWLLNGTSYNTFVALPSPNPSWSIANKTDYDNDGDLDLFWRNRVTGETVIWVMNGISYSTFTSLPAANLNWTIAAVDNFDTDPDREILWRNVATGEIVIWEMNGTNYSSFISLPTPQLGWIIVAVDNFDTDLDREILWRNTTTGETLIWQMNGTSYSSFTPLPASDPNWVIVQVTNFDSDPDREILWRNAATGETLIWEMNGTSYSSFASLPPTPLSWSVVEVNNFDSDPDREILWRNATTGETLIWQMNGLSYSSFTPLPTPTTIWSIVESRDYDGDGSRDLLWRNRSTGETLIWRLNNGSFTSFVTLPAPLPSWQIV